MTPEQRQKIDEHLDQAEWLCVTKSMADKPTRACLAELIQAVRMVAETERPDARKRTAP